MKGNFLNYNDLLALKDFEYFFRFKRIERNFEELWRMKSTARESLKEWLLSIHILPETSEVISNAASELIENCIKYSAMNEYSFVYINVFEKKIYIETVNKATKDQIDNVKNFLDYVRTSNKTPDEIYIEKIQQSYTKGISQLGLIKIILETKGNIEIIDEEKNDIIHIRVQIDA